MTSVEALDLVQPGGPRLILANRQQQQQQQLQQKQKQ
jgi:hypothetical protein